MMKNTTAMLPRAIRLVWNLGPRWNAAALGMALVQSILPLASLYALKLLVDAIAEALRTGTPALFWISVLPLAILAGVSALLEAAGRSLAGYIGQAQAQAVSDGIADRIHRTTGRLDLSFYERPASHDALYRAQQESPQRSAALVDDLIRTVRGSLSLAAMVGLLLGLGWWAALLLFLAALPGIALKLRYSEKLFRWEKEQTGRERQSWYYHWMLTDAGHAKEVILFGLNPWFSRKYRRLRQALRLGRLKIFSRRWIGELVVLALSLAVVYGALVVMAFRAVQGAITLGALVMFFQVLQRGSGFLQDIMSGLAGLYEENLFLGALFSFLDLKPEGKRPAALAVDSMPDDSIIRFERVGFRYPAGDSAALSDIDLELRPGETIALVGANGSGKTTLVKLLCRLYDPSSGRITAGGTDLRDLDPEGWRGRISALFQDHVRYNLSAGQNIAISDNRSAFDNDSIRLAAARAGAAQAIESLPEQYRTVLGHWFSKGYDLSHGQWQKVALARALFRPADLLILDEPTSAMDAASAALVLETLREFLKGRTAVIVSHSFPAVRLARTICVLERGRIVERGSHDNLIGANGRYAGMFGGYAQTVNDSSR